MKTFATIIILIAIVCSLSFGLHKKNAYSSLYDNSLDNFKQAQIGLANMINNADLTKESDVNKIKQEIKNNRVRLKAIDFWLRYFEPIAYRKINGPLPVEWETEVFEKFEPPYRRTGAGLILAELYLDEPLIHKDSLLHLVDTSIKAITTFEADSITSQLSSYPHFFLANRLFLLNLAAIYTTGFECPDTSAIIPELRLMLPAVKKIYQDYDASFASTALSSEYLELYDQAIAFINSQPEQFSLFDHFTFINNYVNPLFRLNQQFINSYGVTTINFNDYTLNNQAVSIFDKRLFDSQNNKGIFSLVEDDDVPSEIKQIGKLLFYDPILSGNNKRSCASCHKPTEYFTDTTLSTPLQFDDKNHLPRNAPSLVNSVFNHLIMLDGKHISLQAQAKEVITSTKEMNSNEQEMLKKVLSCKEYKRAFKQFLKYTPEEKDVSLSHIVSAITFYYSDFSNYYSPFDEAINNSAPINEETKKGFNLFMSKAQCATCHFVPHFNGIKPPYIGSEFEILGVPDDTSYTKLSSDKGRYTINPASEMTNAFRTTTIRNVEFTKPYMHNGVFQTLEQVIDFYDGGGGAGRNLDIPNQTLASDSLKLAKKEKELLITFMHSLNEKIIFETPPVSLPQSSEKSLNNRRVGGEY